MAEPNPERRRVRKLTKRKRTDDAEDSDGSYLAERSSGFIACSVLGLFDV